MFNHISKHLKVRRKYSAVRRIFNSLLDISNCSQTPSFVLDSIPSRSRIQLAEKILLALGYLDCPRHETPIPGTSIYFKQTLKHVLRMRWF